MSRSARPGGRTIRGRPLRVSNAEDRLREVTTESGPVTDGAAFCRGTCALIVSLPRKSQNIDSM